MRTQLLLPAWFRTSGIAILFSALILPLLNLPPWFSPPDWGKEVAFRLLMASLVLLFGIGFALEPKSFSARLSSLWALGKSSKLVWTTGVLLFFFILGTLFSLDHMFSIWGSPSRAGGMISLLCFFIFSFFLVLLFPQSAWKNAWRTHIGVAFLVSIIALFQQFGILSSIFVSFASRPPSTIGGPIFLAIYLLIIAVIVGSMAFSAKAVWERVFYSLCSGFFLFVIIFITQSRAGIIGLGAAGAWFAIMYPKRMPLLRIGAVSALLLVIGGGFFLAHNPQLYAVDPLAHQMAKRPDLFKQTLSRVASIFQGGNEARLSAWKISTQAMLARPVFGYGPENFSIAFDRFYDPALPNISKLPDGTLTTWWDRAHNFFFDTAIQAGIPAAFAYILLIGALLWTLQKMKKLVPDRSMFVHGIQSAVVGYIVANMFSFDVFSTSLLFFFILAQTLAWSQDPIPVPTANTPARTNRFATYAVLGACCIAFIFLAWYAGIKPLRANAHIEIANSLAQSNQCTPAFTELSRSLSINSSAINQVARISYRDLSRVCNAADTAQKLQIAQQGYELLKQNVIARPTYTRNWIFFGEFINILIEASPDRAKNLQQEAEQAFVNAHQLSPKRQEVYPGWIKSKLVTGEYLEAISLSQECIALHQSFGECWWLQGLSYAFQDKSKQSQEAISIAKEYGYDTSSVLTLHQLSKAYATTYQYAKLAETYEKLIAQSPISQYYASLAIVYRELKDYTKARQSALKVLDLQPEAKAQVEEFLRSLPR